MANNMDGRPSDLRLSGTLQVILIAGFVVYAASTLRDWIKPSCASAAVTRQQRTYAIGPNTGTQAELDALLADGWRIVQLSSSSSQASLDNTVYHAVLLENSEVKAQEILFLDPRSRDSLETKTKLAQMFKQGWRITQMAATAAPQGGQQQSLVVFVLEK